MAYTALSEMRQFNKKRFGKDCGPFPPEKHFKDGSNDLKSAVLRFLHDRCEELNFDSDKEKEERTKKKFLGNSLKKEQIPYNMEMDVNRLCLERELERFIDSGTAEDAYTVYFCYMEMFFGEYGSSKKRVELLSEFESNGSSILMKHRDHYSHTVYVFALGLAIYETNASFRMTFKKFYGFDSDDGNTAEDRKAAHFFLEYWGLTALFHDIGYPFEIPFEQVCSYYEVEQKERTDKSVYIAYQNVKQLTVISRAMKTRLNKDLYHRRFADTNELFAYDIFQKLGRAYSFSERTMLEKIKHKPSSPNKYSYHMDHAWFSANLLFQKLMDISKPGTGRNRYIIQNVHIDALTAILLHNSLFKFSIAFYKGKDETNAPQTPLAPLKKEQHPLAYLLMLCDELQCWDRTAYGRSTKQEAHPFDAEFEFFPDKIDAMYLYDSDDLEKIGKYKDDYIAHLRAGLPDDDRPKLKTYSTMYDHKQSFAEDIKNIVDLTGIDFSCSIRMAQIDRNIKHSYLSVSNFLHLYDFAVVLNARYNYNGKEDAVAPAKLEKEFENLSLEYKLSNINQAKSFSKYLNAIGCFYTDRAVSYRILDHFEELQTAVFAPMEHKRWVLEHQWMGWRYGEYYETEEAQKKSGITDPDSKVIRDKLREQLRMHKLAMDGALTDEKIQKHYDELSDEDKGKDWKPFNSMLKLIKKFDGLRIYQLD